jgi:hypothetical protein
MAIAKFVTSISTGENSVVDVYQLKYNGLVFRIDKHTIGSHIWFTAYVERINDEFYDPWDDCDEDGYPAMGYFHPINFEPYYEWTWDSGWDYDHFMDTDKDGNYLWDLEKVTKDIIGRTDKFLALSK